tara:strand:- start:1370 stop:1909 length:540 start_codon:yes stop_codon:yes gene_type:complete
MCGIWGFENRSNKIDIAILKETIRNADERGGHAFGFYGITKAYKHILFKKEGRADVDLLTSIAKDCLVGIGQCRLATMGGRDLVDSQPLVFKDYIIVHNGNIENSNLVMSKYNYNPVTGNDTEAILPMLRNNEVNLKGAFMAIGVKYMDYRFISYNSGMPLYKKTNNGVEYYCSKKWQY